MKYTLSNPPLTCILTNSYTYAVSKGRLEPEGIVWTTSGRSGARLCTYMKPANSNVNHEYLIGRLGSSKLNNDKIQRGYHYWIGKLDNGHVTSVQGHPLNRRARACGQGVRTNFDKTHLQICICEDRLKDKEYCRSVFNEACNLSAYLCRLYNIPVYKVIGHDEAYKMGGAYVPEGPGYWFEKFGFSMELARKEISHLLFDFNQKFWDNNYKVDDKVYLIPRSSDLIKENINNSYYNKENKIVRIIDNKVVELDSNILVYIRDIRRVETKPFPYEVKALTNLALRKEPNKNSKRIAIAQKGESILILKEQNGWGLNQMGSWACLKYTAPNN